MCAQTQVDRFESCGALALKVPSVHARKAFDKRAEASKSPGNRGFVAKRAFGPFLACAIAGFALSKFAYAALR